MQLQVNRHSLYYQVLMVILFFVITPLTLVFSSISLVSISKSAETDTLKSRTDVQNISTKVLASADFDEFPTISSNIVIADGRAEILKKYLNTVDSELEPYSKFLVEMADKYGLDFRLLPAIAIKESGACRVIPPGGYNCWGWGIHSEGTLGFDSYEEAIETVAKGLKENYIDLGYITPNQIMTKYAHPDSTTWGPDVEAYMQTLE